MLVRMRERYRHEAIKTKDVGGNAHSDLGVAWLKTMSGEASKSGYLENL